MSGSIVDWFTWPSRFWSVGPSVTRAAAWPAVQSRAAHPPEPATVDVEAGDLLEIAQWQRTGEWLWGARLAEQERPVAHAAADVVALYLPRVQERLRHPAGPPLKMFTHGQAPLRAVAALYGMILRGYAPRSVHVLGEHQWSPRARRLLEAALPFAEIVPTADVLGRAAALGGQATHATAAL